MSRARIRFDSSRSKREEVVEERPFSGPRTRSYKISGLQPWWTMRDAPQEIRTFFVTSVANGRRPVFRPEGMARLLLDVLQRNREACRFLLHEFVVMPDHFHLILTPAETVSLEKALQYIKGGFSFRAKRELNYRFLICRRASQIIAFEMKKTIFNIGSTFMRIQSRRGW